MHLAALRLLSSAVAFSVLVSPLAAQTIYPIDRATILTGAKFDFKVEFPALVQPANVKITINGEDYSQQLGKTGEFIENEDGLNASSVVLRDASIAKPGNYKVVATDGKSQTEVTWSVFATGPRVARNVILFIGDGMSMANRTAARVLSKEILWLVGDRRHAAYGADRHIGSRLDRDRLSQFDQRLYHRPQIKRQRARRLRGPQ
jgi:alkaline phosphatase